MAGPALPVNIDTTYADTGDASVPIHQQHHDSIHTVVNEFDKDATPVTGQQFWWDGSLWQPHTPFIGTWAFVRKEGSNYVAYKYDGTSISSGTNPATVINAAITACSAGGGGYVWLSNGSYVITASITLATGVVLTGEGSWGRSSDGGVATGYGAIITNGGGGAGFTMVSMPTTAYGCRVEHIMVDGSSATRASVGVAVKAGDQRVFECCVQDCTTGIDVNATGASILTAPEISGCMVQNCGTGISVSGGTTDGTISRCRVLQSSTTSVTIGSGGWQIWGCHITTGATGATRALIASSSPCMIFGNYFDTHRNGSVLVEVTGNRTTIAGNYFIDGTAAGGVHILLPSSPRCSITGNTFTASNTAKAFVKFSGTVQNCSIVGNHGEYQTGSAQWVATVINSSNLAVADTNTSTTYVQGNTAYAGTD